jgi:hypothetical protein
MYQKKIMWFKKRRYVHPLLSSGYISDAPRRVRKTFLLIYTWNYKWPRNIALSIFIYTLFLPFSKILLIQRARLFRPIYYIMVKIVLTRIKKKLYSHSILISFLKGLQPLVINIRSFSFYIYNPKHIWNLQYSFSLDSNYVRKFFCLSLFLYPNRLY